MFDMCPSLRMAFMLLSFWSAAVTVIIEYRTGIPVSESRSPMLMSELGFPTSIPSPVWEALAFTMFLSMCGLSRIRRYRSVQRWPSYGTPRWRVRRGDCNVFQMEEKSV